MRTTSIVTTAASIVALLSITGQARAQLNRAFVSGHGADANPCTLAAPCRTFAQALTQTNAGGEIAVLDTAGYGAVTIAKSVTITNPGGVEAGVTAAINQDAIQINAGASAVNVTLRGMTLQGASGSANGIDWASGGGELNVIDCVVKDFGSTGIVISPASGSPSLNVTISNTTVLHNTDGIEIAPLVGAGPISYSISHTITNVNVDNGILVSGGLAAGSISSIHSEMNGNGLSFDPTNDESIIISNSIFRNNIGTDIVDGNTAISSIIFLYDANTINTFSIPPGQQVKSDGTNNIISAISGGGSLTKVPPQ